MKKKLNTKQIIIVILSFILIIAIITIAIIMIDKSNKPDEGTFPEPDVKKIMFNSQYTPYEGNSIGANLVKGLISKVEESNNIKYSDDELKVTLKGITKVSDIETSKTYNVAIEYDEQGYVSVITIKEK